MEPLGSHQLSPEGVIEFLVEAPLDIHQRNSARRRFYHIVEHFGAGGATDNSVPPQYEPPRLIRCTYEYALSDESRDNFLRAFFRAMTLSLTTSQDNDNDNDNDLSDLEHIRPLFFNFAAYLLDNFFLPSNDYFSPFLLPSSHALSSLCRS